MKLSIPACPMDKELLSKAIIELRELKGRFDEISEELAESLQEVTAQINRMNNALGGESEVNN